MIKSATLSKIAGKLGMTDLSLRLYYGTTGDEPRWQDVMPIPAPEFDELVKPGDVGDLYDCTFFDGETLMGSDLCTKLWPKAMAEGKEYHLVWVNWETKQALYNTTKGLG